MLHLAPAFSLLSVLALSFTDEAGGAAVPGDSDISAFIISGSEALDGKYPWNLSFQRLFGNQWRHECGAALIADRWAVTASHCVFYEKTDGTVTSLRGTQMRIVAGAHTVRPLDADAQIRYFSRVVTPFGQNIVYDVALLQLETALNTTRSDITPILVANGSEPNTTGNCMISGWGVTNLKSRIFASTLHEARTNLISAEDCKTPDWPTAFTHICGEGQPQGVSGCYGDSGAPLTCYRDDGTPVLMGISSYVYTDCLAERPNIFQKMSVYRNWLRTLTKIPDI